MSQRDHTPEEIAEFKKDNPQNFPPEPTVAEQLLDETIEKKLEEQRIDEQLEAMRNASVKRVETTGPTQGEGGSGATVPVLHVASERAYRAATNAVHELGCGVITLTFDATGAYQFRSGDINVTYAIGLLHRAILSLQNTAQATPFR